MSFEDLASVPCTIHPSPVPAAPVDGRVPRDDMGNPETSQPADVDSYCSPPQQTTTTELRDGQLIVVSVWNLYVRADAPLGAWDAVTVQGARYEIEGRPWPVRHPRQGHVSHIEAVARRVE